MSRVVACVALIVASRAGAFAQVTSLNSDRHYILGARAVGLADSYVSESPDAGAMYWNPASLSFAQKTALILNYGLEKVFENDNIMTENGVVPITLDETWRLGLGVTVSHVGSIRDSADPLLGLKYHQYGFELGIAARPTRSFSIGMLVGSVYGKGTSTGLGAVTTSFGVFYSPMPGVTYGAVFQGLGWGVEYDVNGTTTVPHQVRLDRSFQMGLSAAIPSRPERQVLVVTLSNQKVIGVDGLVYKGGVEVLTAPFLLVRAGYWVGPESAAAKLGAGLRLWPIQLDYGTSLSASEPRIHEFSLVILLGSD